MKKKSITVKELKEDSSFRRLARGIASSEEVEYWNEWIESNEENRKKAKQALSDLVGFEFQSLPIPDLDEEWRQLQDATVNRKSLRSSFQNRDKNENTLKWVFRTAAILLLVGLAGVGAYFFNDNNPSEPLLEQLTEERIITTDQAEHKTLRFTNGSKVILNSKSSLTYRLGNTNSSTIEVTLEGEAWFEAGPNREGDQPAFAISTPDGIIRDIGTKFLVTVENGLSRIVLQEGLVEVEPLDRAEPNSGSENLKFRVQQGEMVEFRRTDIISRRNVNPSFYSSWATGVLELSNSGVVEFAQYVEKRFEIDVELKDPSLRDIQLNGTVYFRSLDELMRSVSEVIGIPVYRSADRDTVYIGN